MLYFNPPYLQILLLYDKVAGRQYCWRVVAYSNMEYSISLFNLVPTTSEDLQQQAHNRYIAMTKWFEDSLAFYAAYHHDSMNKFVHILCVWPILYTALLFLHYAPAPNAIANLFPDHNVTWATIFAFLYAAYYFFIEQPGFAGPLASAMVVGGYLLTEALAVSFQDAWKVGIVIHVFCWVAQIYGHQVFEKRSPAFLDNIVQALVMAPLFVLLEVLFPLGYKKELQEKVEKVALKNIEEFRKNQKKSK
jgi:uncharacterized membrane protein YGL010W